MAVWFGGGSALVCINEVNLRRARLVLGWVTVSTVQLTVPENLSQYISSHPGQLTLATPPWLGAMSTSMATATAREENGEFCVPVAPCDQDCWHTDLVA